MKRMWILCLLLATAASVPAQSRQDEATAGYVEKFEVPERDEAGNLRWKLSGDRAQFMRDGQLQVENLRAEFFSSNIVALVFTSPACLLDQRKKTATTDAPVRLESANLVVTGNGADWVGESNSFLVRSNVHVVISAERSRP
jgi:hypothetical protein